MALLSIGICFGHGPLGNVRGLDTIYNWLLNDGALFEDK